MTRRFIDVYLQQARGGVSSLSAGNKIERHEIFLRARRRQSPRSTLVLRRQIQGTLARLQKKILPQPRLDDTRGSLSRVR